MAPAHYSAQEYLVSDRIKQGPSKQYSVQESDYQDTITEGSLKYLIQFDNALTEEVLRTSALAQYAAGFWSSHLRKMGDKFIFDFLPDSGVLVPHC